MIVRFWGVRGSIPTPLTADAVRRKIAAVVQRIEHRDLESQESRERFLAGLPAQIFGTVGGNTTCVETMLDDGVSIVFDAGSGLRELGVAMKKRNVQNRVYHLFFTHFHWDHLQGLPFFAPLFDKNSKIILYSTSPHVEEYVRSQMKAPYFPVTLDMMAADVEFVTLTGKQRKIGGATVTWRDTNHPGGCTSYRVQEDGRAVVFSTDTELTERDFEKTPENGRYYQDTDVVVMDAQYTLGEAIEKYDWGHSSYSLAVDFASAWGIKHLVLFHHEPLYGDSKMYGILKSAEWYAGRLMGDGVRISLAREGLEIPV